MKILKNAALIACVISLVGLPCLKAHADDHIGQYGNYGFVQDEADLLSTEEEMGLLEKLESDGAAHDLQIAVVTVESYEQSDILYYGDDVMDYNDWGFAGDEAVKAILLAFCPTERTYAVVIENAAAGIFTDNAQTALDDMYIPYLRDGRYYDAFASFSAGCDKICRAYENGESTYDQYGEKDKGISGVAWWKWLICLLGGGLFGMAPVSSMKAALKNVVKNDSAGMYKNPGGMNLTGRQDLFLRKNVSRTKIQHDDNKSSGGGGHTTMHHASSGHSHAGHSGKL
ncbi:TPM domain-containing protein [Butyrivibrio sp. MC2013]|uniref:TPM domain-containing protein n=1 Tax=Butyrivibrio sp. MC2013 TaxID=1280686 RepID=UPI000427EADC|nr:TPM domain-containing protein [Butyrivibrio sp. MC2013]